MHLIDRFLFDTQWAENVKKVQTNNTQSPHLCWSISYATKSYITITIVRFWSRFSSLFQWFLHYFLQIRPLCWQHSWQSHSCYQHSGSHLQKILQKPLKSDLNPSKTFLQFSNVIVSCVKYHGTKKYLAIFHLVLVLYL